MLNQRYINKLRELMIKNSIDVMIIGPSVDLNFLTGFNPHICERFQAFFFLSNGEYFHISPQLYFELLLQQVQVLKLELQLPKYTYTSVENVYLS